MNKFKLVGLKKRNTNLQQVIIMTMDKRNFQVLKKCLIKENKMMKFRDTSLPIPPSPQWIISTRKWTRMFVWAKEETSAPILRSRRLRQRKVHKRTFNGESSYLLYI